MPVWQYILTGGTFIIFITSATFLALKYSEKHDFRVSMWIIAPIFTLVNIGLTVLMLCLVDSKLACALVISVSWSISLGLMLGVSYYKQRNRIQFSRTKKGLL